jgi:Ubiquitin-conjugating enzyme/von Willebrand factor type A domain
VQLFLTACPLRTTDEKDTLIGDLLSKTEGSLRCPLDIYIIPTSGKPTDADCPETLWAFESSKRGTATFQTCLKFVIDEARKVTSDAPKRHLLKTYFRVTHFAPALTALHTLLEENKLEPDSVVVLATCFRELALRMAPGQLIGNSIKAALECSRQVFAWLDSKARESPDEVDDPEAALVRTVEFKEITDEQVLNEYRVGKRCDIVEFNASGDPMRAASSSEPRKTRQVKVWTASNCRENVRLLAMAMWGHYDHTGDFYVDFQDNIDSPANERRTPLVSRREFQRLLATANSHPHLRMTAPKDLQNCRTAITLSKDGYVSVFDQNEGYNKDVRPTTWNAISGTEMLDSSFIKTLEAALELISKERKMEGTWDLDDWHYIEKCQPLDVIPHEAIVICFDLSWSMDGKLGYDWTGAPNDFTKLAEIRQVFENVIARMRGYHLLSNFIGVVTFASKDHINITTDITQLSQLPEDFKDMMADKKTEGVTALWDAVDKAKDMLLAFKKSHSKAKLRIIALTDGHDNQSTKEPSDLCKDLYDAEIVFDSLAVGTGATRDLFNISKHTGGYAFRPTSRLLLYQIFLLEPFLDISARPDIERIPIADYSTSKPKEPDMKTMYDFPPCRPHPLEKGSYICLSDKRRFFATRSTPSLGQTRTSNFAQALLPDRRLHLDGLPTKTVHPSLLKSADTLSISSDRSTVSSGRILMKEIDFILANGESYFDVYINETDMSFWKVVMSGPKNSPYEKGSFVLSVSLTETFPQTPPLIRFLTPVLHPNITKVSSS